MGLKLPECPQCAFCFWYEPMDPSCRRHAPSPMSYNFLEYIENRLKTQAGVTEAEALDGHAMVWWPKVDKYDFCGEYKEANEDQVSERLELKLLDAKDGMAQIAVKIG